MFDPLPGKVEILPDHVVKDLSRDQLLAYKYAQAIQSGNTVTENVQNQTKIGQILNKNPTEIGPGGWTKMLGQGGRIVFFSSPEVVENVLTSSLQGILTEKKSFNLSPRDL